MADNIPVNALQTSLEIIETLKEYDGCTLTELSTEIEASRTTVFNHLKTLEREGYVVRTDDSYRVSCRFLEVGAKARDHHDVYNVAREEVDRLAEETGEISAVLIEEQGRGVFLHREEGLKSVHIDSYVGQRIYLHGAALGKVILASLPRPQVDRIIDEHGLPAITENTLTEREPLYDELAEVAEQGYALDDQERLNGLRSVAAPIVDQGGAVLGSLSVAGPVSRIQGQQFHEELPETVKAATNIIELNITYS